MNFLIINPVTGKKVNAGELKEGIFYKKVKTRQKLKILDTYGIEASVVEDLKERGCKKIVIKEEDTGKEHKIAFETFYNKAIRKTFGNSSYQFYLPLKYWNGMDKKEEVEGQISFLTEVG
ncbi:hypothetical protein [Caldanaerobacter subterraneus]|uniref:Uncharacterized protein n=1 Tax=Caldanaerobacter subterraneus subsp. pacificus DSM 12653 TaxID=391606 RepID=A0A0F5PQN8_9THEO|nr:hypothetical protein [Caldanaerobacter subterraneus]KKC30915.1 hypothetical protein CDSM653_00012 [Caldanaerobacter subterraneus subsp. pacificus DSM 12653]